MTSLDEVHPRRVLDGHSGRISAESQQRLATHPLESIETAFPHYQHTVESPDDRIQPRKRHPIFFGCFDWHSAVHSHWSLIRQLRLFDAHPKRDEIIERVENRFVSSKVRGEVEYFEEHPSFEKPYGWAWFLRLIAELALWDTERATRWREVLRPLESEIVSLVESDFLTQNRPFRVGTHQNSAFAIAAVIDYATVIEDHSLRKAAVDRSVNFFVEDREYPVEFEPLEWDFVSPALAEADLMRRVLDPEPFRRWVDQFFPDLTVAPYKRLLEPVQVTDYSNEGIALHFVGLNLSKAWSMLGVADCLDDHKYRPILRSSASDHVEEGLRMAFPDDYAGSHWLSSFALYLVSRNDGGIADAT